jgi:hypothetical protein
LPKWNLNSLDAPSYEEAKVQKGNSLLPRLYSS